MIHGPVLNGGDEPRKVSRDESELLVRSDSA